MSEHFLITMYGTMRTVDESTDEYYGVKWTHDPYTLQEDKEMKGYIPLVTTYEGEIVNDVVFLNRVHNAKYLLTPMNKRD